MPDASALLPTIVSAPLRLVDWVQQTALDQFGWPEPAQRCVDWATRFHSSSPQASSIGNEGR